MNDNTSKKPTNDFDRVTKGEKQEWPPLKFDVRTIKNAIKILEKDDNNPENGYSIAVSIPI